MYELCFSTILEFESGFWLHDRSAKSTFLKLFNAIICFCSFFNWNNYFLFFIFFFDDTLLASACYFYRINIRRGGVIALFFLLCSVLWSLVVFYCGSWRLYSFKFVVFYQFFFSSFLNVGILSIPSIAFIHAKTCYFPCDESCVIFWSTSSSHLPIVYLLLPWWNVQISLVPSM